MVCDDVTVFFRFADYSIIKNMKQPLYIPLETWNTLSWKEQDFIVMLRESRFTKTQIMRRLYITSEV